MATAFVPSSSEFVCDNIARRTVRNAQEQAQRAQMQNFIDPFMKPIMMRLAKSGRFQRDVLHKMVAQLERKLEADETVFALEASAFRKSKLSSNESYRVTFKVPASQDEEWLAFTATELNLTRRSVEVSYAYTDVFIHRHAISRFMQREAKPPEEIYKMLDATINLATVMAWPSAMYERNGKNDMNIAVPLGSGMLFGRLSMSKGGSKRGVFTVDSRSAEHDEKLRVPGFDYMMAIELMTYVDNNSLTPQREALRDRILEFQREHTWGIQLAADSVYFTRLAVPKEIAGQDLQGLIQAARPAIDKLLGSPEWTHFINTVGR